MVLWLFLLFPHQYLNGHSYANDTIIDGPTFQALQIGIHDISLRLWPSSYKYLGIWPDFQRLISQKWKVNLGCLYKIEPTLTAFNNPMARGR